MQGKGGYYFLLFTLLLFVLFRIWPAVGEKIYAQRFYPFLRTVIDATIGRIPYLFLILSTASFCLALYTYRKKPWQVAAVALALFFWLFGFNYATSPLMENVKSGERSVQQLLQFQLRVCDSLVRYAAKVPVNVEAHTALSNDSLVSSMRQTLAPTGRSVMGQPRVHLVAANSGWLSRCGIAGIYFPYALSGFCDATFIPPVRNFVMAHEMAHACSVAPEHEADFFGFQALLNYRGDEDAVNAARYSAYFQLYRSTRRAALTADSLTAESIEQQLPLTVQQHLKLARAHAQLYPEFISGAQDHANQAYLKTLGQTHGIEQYHWLVYTVMDQWTHRK